MGEDIAADQIIQASSGAERLLLLGHLLSAIATGMVAMAQIKKLSELGQLSSLKINSPEAGTVPNSQSRNQNRNYFEL